MKVFECFRSFYFRLLARWRFRHHPRYELLADYETLIRLARRCAYDLRHTVGMLPADHFYRTEFHMDERADWWVSQFAKGNPGKDYRHGLQLEIHELKRQLDEVHAWCAERGLKPPDKRIPF